METPTTPTESFRRRAWRRFRSDPLAVIGLAGILLLLAPAVCAPLLANGRPLIEWGGGDGVRLPFLHFLFAPDSTEYLIEQFFNGLLLLLVGGSVLRIFIHPPRLLRILTAVFAAGLLIPFFTAQRKIDKTDYRARIAASADRHAVFAPIPYGPSEIAGEPCKAPDRNHWLGTDDIGRDVASRMIYGARTSLAVGIFATLIALVIGTAVGLTAGYYRGWFDLAVMRLVEVLLCFPTFLLLLILMSLLKDRKFEQSILIVIAVIGLTGWIGLAFLVRGEVLKQRALPYILSCEVAGIPAWRTMLVHLLPNITGPILISFTFGVAGAILAESGLSFLGFGVQPPTASWGGILRQAFDNPLDYWHLTFFPGAALFWAVLSFNFTGEGLRKAFSERD